MISMRIAGTASLQEGALHRTVDLAAQAMPDRDAEKVRRLVGIEQRRWLGRGERVTDVGARVLAAALEDAGMEATELRRIIFVSSTGGDVLIPANANRVAFALGLDDTADCFDLNNACVGFLTAVDLAARCVATDFGPVAIVVVENLSHYVEPDTPRPYVVMADAAAAAIVTSTEGDEGLLGSSLRNRVSHCEQVELVHPGRTDEPVRLRFHAGYKDLRNWAFDAMRESSEAALEQAGLSFDTVRWVLPHQPNGAMLTDLLESFGVDADRTIRVVDEIGSVGSASVPTSLDRLRRRGRMAAGDEVLLTAVGAGTAFGALVLRF